MLNTVLHDVCRKLVPKRCGNCLWEIDEDGVLTISPVRGTDGRLFKEILASWPWWKESGSIKKVVIMKGVTASEYMGGLFSNFSNCEIFDIENLDTGRTRDMSFLFAGCSKLTDVSFAGKWNVICVENVFSMFCDCISLVDINALGKWRYGKILRADRMFMRCSSLKNADALRNWNVCDLRKADGMFDGSGVSINPLDDIVPMACPREGSFIAWKVCSGERLVKLRIPEDARRSSAFGKKCRCDRAEVLEIQDADGNYFEYAKSYFDWTFSYAVGRTAEAASFNSDRFREDGAGITFFVDVNDALNHYNAAERFRAVSHSER